MLLPSAPLACDSAQTAHARLQSGLFVSPPASPPTLSSQGAFGNIVTTCRSLQSLLAAPAASTTTPPPSLEPLPTPPLAHAPSPLKLRLRSRQTHKTDSASSQDTIAARRRVIKRVAPRGVNKRRRGVEDDAGRDEVESECDNDAVEPQSPSPQAQQEPAAPSTPKRARIAPEQLPLGLERSDFHNVHLLPGGVSSETRRSGSDVEVEADGQEWSAEDDRILVELVLDKLKLSKTEWQDCARGLGKDRHSVSRRWKSLVMNGDVGVKRSSRRAKLHSTWR